MQENPAYLTQQILTYMGNKRKLLGFIGQGILAAKEQLNQEKLTIFDLFTGSGIVARYCKQFSKHLYVNDLEYYSFVTAQCYLSNPSQLDMKELKEIYYHLNLKRNQQGLQEGLLSQHYAPLNDMSIRQGERVFYTRYNAQYIDTMRAFIANIPSSYQSYFLAPLLAMASVHANTSGVFKGFHKKEGIGHFGGSKADALSRIQAKIQLPFPLFSNFECPFTAYQGNANEVAKQTEEVDLAYLDPPYNQHPYGSNYFMLNLIAQNQATQTVSKVSGIPTNWNRSSYNNKEKSYQSLKQLVSDIKAKFVLISFNNEGFIGLEEMTEMLQKIGKVQILQTSYPTFRGCRNLKILARQGHKEVAVTEYLYLLKK